MIVSVVTAPASGRASSAISGSGVTAQPSSGFERPGVLCRAEFSNTARADIQSIPARWSTAIALSTWSPVRWRPAEPVETDSNDEPAADASGDSDDERPDENQAVPDRS